jgi:SAM-dependent methyltransferase
LAAPTDGPPRHVRVIGQAATRVVTRFPAAWPLLRGPVRRFFDRAAAEWNERTTAASEPLEAAFDSLPSPPARVLDIGTGTGRAAVAAARRFPEATVAGVDISAEMIRLAGEGLDAELAGRVSFGPGDASSVPFRDGEFDLVIHLNVPVFFAETARLLAPGGHAIVIAGMGSATPIYVPHDDLRRGFERHGLSEAASGTAGVGIYFVARRSGSS